MDLSVAENLIHYELLKLQTAAKSLILLKTKAIPVDKKRSIMRLFCKQGVVDRKPGRSLSYFISQRLVYDHINDSGLSITKIPLPNELLKSCKLAHCRYNSALENQKMKVSKDENKRKRKLKMEEIADVKGIPFRVSVRSKKETLST